ncbi:MAG: protein translocase subunit SecD [Chloroflexi bacterium]|nr:protein translocase subunit SecD [Chloroflexota bacterium]
MVNRDMRRLALVVILVAVAVWGLAVKSYDINIFTFNFARGEDDGPLGLTLGLDLQGGVQLIYEAVEDGVTASQMAGVQEKIERRTNAFGVTEPSIQLLGENRILIQLPGVEDVEEAKRLIGQTGKLEFKERICNDAACTDFSDIDIGLTGELLARAYAGTHPTTGNPIVNLEFNSEGARLFAESTARIAGTNNRTAIFLDNDEIVAPVARQPILGGQAFIEGPDFTFERVRTISIQLEEGRLDTPIAVISEQNVDATLGEESLNRSLVAGMIGFGLVVLFMILYYRVPGIMASLALICYIVLVMFIVKLVPVTLTLAGIAGFILSIGVAVDANILISERTKEELRTGRALLGAIATGFSRAWPAILNSNVATMITCAILFWFGSRFGASAVTGFAVTLFIGVATSMFTAVIISQTLLRILAMTPLSHFTGLFTPVPGRRATVTGPGRRSQAQGGRG